MPPLYSCGCCGFLSTKRDAYERVNGVLYCEQCAPEIRAKAEANPAANVAGMAPQSLPQSEER